MIITETKVHIVIKGLSEKPLFNNRFSIEWPFNNLPSIGHYIDIKTFMTDPDERINETYRVDMIQWTVEGPYIMLLPIR